MTVVDPEGDASLLGHDLLFIKINSQKKQYPDKFRMTNTDPFRVSIPPFLIETPFFHRCHNTEIWISNPS